MEKEGGGLYERRPQFKEKPGTLLAGVYRGWHALKAGLAAMLRYWNEKTIKSGMILDRVSARKNENELHNNNNTRWMR